MNNVSIHDVICSIQEQNGVLMLRWKAFTNLIHNIINEYGTYGDGTFQVNVNELCFHDKKLILSYLLDSEEYAWCLENHLRIEIAFSESKEFISELIDSECFTVYREIMEEHGMVMKRHSDNNEIFWSR